jgi:hypothetical protein
MDDGAYTLYGHPKSFLFENATWFGYSGLIGFSIAAFLGEALPLNFRSKRYSETAVNHALTALVAVTVAANFVLLLPAIINPGMLAGHLFGSHTDMYSIREDLNRIPRITSFVYLQSLVVVVAMNYPVLSGRALPYKFRVAVVIVVFLSIIRAWLWSERLALIEIALPAALILAARHAQSQRRWANWAWRCAPIIGIAALFILFSAGEYFRPWQFYKFYFSGTYLDFILIRLAGYYATAINNGAAIYEIQGTLISPALTIEWFYRLPLWTLLDINLTQPFDDLTFFKSYLNPEFDNLSGLYAPLLDFGIPGGTFCLMLFGVASGLLCNAFTRRNIWGLVYFPVWFTGVMELLRVFYWGDPRFVPVTLGAITVIFYLSKSPNTVLGAARTRTEGTLSCEDSHRC